MKIKCPHCQAEINLFKQSIEEERKAKASADRVLTEVKAYFNITDE